MAYSSLRLPSRQLSRSALVISPRTCWPRARGDGFAAVAPGDAAARSASASAVVLYPMLRKSSWWYRRRVPAQPRDYPASARAAIAPGCGPGSAGFEVFDHQLDRASAAVVVGLQAVGQARARRRGIPLPGAEVDRRERPGHAFGTEFQAQVALADHAPAGHLELTVEQRLREALPPRPAVAQRFGVEAVELMRRQRAVAVQRGLEDGGIQHGGGMVLERRLERLQARGV